MIFIKFYSNSLALSAIMLYSFSLTFFMLALMLFNMKTLILINWNILFLNTCSVSLPLLLDPWGTLFSSVVCFISANIMLFSTSYMSEESFISRFIHLILLFVLSMNLLIFIPSMISLLIGWDGLGLVSFLLVIYYQNSKSLAAGMITALTNRVGDMLILLSIAWTISQGHWLMLNMWENEIMSSKIVIILLMFAAMTKSAQIPFSSWLPAAMAAPTPVSALVHSSTLVTAGVFLLFRFYHFLSSSPYFNKLLLILGALTMLMAGTAAVIESDMKKIIALSTLSQLGVMMTTLGLGMPLLTFFHLITHALFKALLFICAGSLINLHHHSQDLRSMGSTISQMPLTMSCLLIANMALCGAPFLAGFYSKDLIIESALFISFNFIITIIFLIATMLTSAYSTRFIMSVTLGPKLSLSASPVNDKDKFMYTPSMMLTSGAVLMGVLVMWLSLAPSSEPILNSIYKMSALIVTLMGVFFTMFMSNMKWTQNKSLLMLMPKIHLSFSYMWLMTSLSTQFILMFPYKLSLKSIKLLDQGWYEFFGPQGKNIMISNMVLKNSMMQSNKIDSVMILSFMFMLIMLFNI
uniref:NADH-ubiquinone oxidoreductase chain 5 n=1 Tax=Eusyllis blomstrandi TaxID=199554 RepID=A0A1C9UZC0_EUSBL|nr:NADH dehydrogenase subunit 5 [Eusyllis blomstrandi]AOR87120.1 NADH dehydrogenase subunit 5 [Eusyllis blomstrandi]